MAAHRRGFGVSDACPGSLPTDGVLSMRSLGFSVNTAVRCVHAAPGYP